MWTVSAHSTSLLFLAVLLGVDLWGIHLFRRNGIPLHFQEVSATAQDALGKEEPLVSAPDSAYLRAEAIAGGVPAAGLSGEPLVREVLRWTMDQVRATGQGVGTPRPSAREQLAHARAGGGLHCGQMADLFVETLRGFGVNARIVTLASSLSPRTLLVGTSTHTVVEVLLDGRWVIFDPTFHVSYRRGGRLLGAAEVHDALVSGNIGEVEPVFHGEVAYPARLESYPVPWMEHFRHVLVAREHDTAIWKSIPPQRYWMGARYYHVGDEGARQLDALYFTLVVAVPALCLLRGLSLVLALSSGSGRSAAVLRPALAFAARTPWLPSRGVGVLIRTRGRRYLPAQRDPSPSLPYRAAPSP